MAKEAYYFTHDYGSRNDPKLQKVLMKLGHEGKSVYWDLVEMLYEEGGYLDISECENYAFALRTNKSCIDKLISEFDLFQSNDKNFWSLSVLRRLDKRDEKSKKASASAKTRWDKANALKTDANASKNDARKESKGNKKKIKNPFTVATLDATQSVIVTNQVKQHFLDIYAVEYGTSYYFQAKDGVKIQSITKKVFFKMKEKDNREIFTSTEIIDSCKFFLSASLISADNWLKSNYNLSNVDSKFNDIFTQIKNYNNNGKKLTRESIYQQTKSVFAD